MNISFTPITLQEQSKYLTFLKQCPDASSDYSFINLWGWQEEYGLEWAFTDDAVLIKQAYPTPCLWAPVGHWENMNWQAYRDLCAEFPVMVRVPEPLKDMLTARWPKLEVTEDRGQWDYLYAIEELIALAGRKFHKKKNLVNRFFKTYDYEYVVLTPQEIEMALTLQTEWFLWKNTESDSTLGMENRSIVKVMRDWERLENIFGAGLVVDGKMIAYTIAETAPNGQVIIHFEKGCPNYKGVYQAINQLFLKHSCTNKTLVNREQDLGDPGLRTAKESYNPVRFIQKYALQGF